MGRVGGLARLLATGLLVGLTGGFLVLSPIGLDLERRVGLGLLFALRGPAAPPEDVVVVAIDGRTGEALGQPRLPHGWPRTLHADLVRRLEENGAAVIVFDIDFNRAGDPAEDRSLAAAIAASGRVLLFERLEADRAAGVELRRPPNPVLARSARATAPFPLPKTGAAVAGFWTFRDESGGVATLPAAALQLAAEPARAPFLEALRAAGAGDAAASFLSTDADAFERAMLATRRMVLRHRGGLAVLRRGAKAWMGDPSALSTRALRALPALYGGPGRRVVNLYGPPGAVQTLPYEAVLRGDLGAVSLRGKAVFVGYADPNDPDQPDAFHTVFTSEAGVDVSGVELMATAFANLLDGRDLKPLSARDHFLLVAAFGLCVGGAARLLPPLWAALAAPTFAALYIAGALWVFQAAALWAPVATPLLVQLPLALGLGLGARYVQDHRRERRMARVVAHYLPAAAARALDAGELDPGAVNKVVYGACLATDMTGFTRIAENMPPKDLARFMNAYFDGLSETLKRHGVDITGIQDSWLGTTRCSVAPYRPLWLDLATRCSAGSYTWNCSFAPL